jgi:hypothetical protein
MSGLEFHNRPVSAEKALIILEMNSRHAGEVYYGPLISTEDAKVNLSLKEILNRKAGMTDYTYGVLEVLDAKSFIPVIRRAGTDNNLNIAKVLDDSRARSEFYVFALGKETVVILNGEYLLDTRNI